MSFERSHTYEALSRIGRGASGTVYKAKDRKTGNDVALKKVIIPLSENGIPMHILREISLLKQLNSQDHPNIVRLLDVCQGPQTDKELIMYLVFEHVEQDLATYIERHPKGFSALQIRNLSKEILNGVDFLHGSRIVHRDLKPQNLLVVTLWYRAPEVLLGLPYATPVDIWSVGCILVELYSLKPLFCGTSEGDQLSKIFRIDEISPNICETAYDLIMSMLAFNPSKRITALGALNHKFFKEEPINT
nr:unnamed protein product [Callosobruchus analis]